MAFSEIQNVGAILRDIGDETNQTAQANENVAVVILFIFLTWTQNQQRQESYEGGAINLINLTVLIMNNSVGQWNICSFQRKIMYIVQENDVGNNTLIDS